MAQAAASGANASVNTAQTELATELGKLKNLIPARKRNFNFLYKHLKKYEL